MSKKMDEICDNCGRRRGYHYGEPDDSCYGYCGDEIELFESCKPKVYSNIKGDKEE